MEPGKPSSLRRSTSSPSIPRWPGRLRNKILSQRRAPLVFLEADKMNPLAKREGPLHQIAVAGQKIQRLAFRQRRQLALNPRAL